MKIPLVAVSGCVLALALSGCGMVADESRPVVHLSSAAVENLPPTEAAFSEPITMDSEMAPSVWVPALPAFWDCPSRREWTWRGQPHFSHRS